MSIALFFIGFFVIIMGFGYLYRPEKVQVLNAWLRENIFSDRVLITHRRRAGVFLIVLGALIIYFVLRS